MAKVLDGARKRLHELEGTVGKQNKVMDAQCEGSKRFFDDDEDRVGV